MSPVVTEEVPGYDSNSGFVLSQTGHYLSISHNWAEHDWTMGEHSPDDNIIYFEAEEDELTPDDKMLRFVDKNGLVPSSSGTVYDRTTVLIEQDPGTLEDEDDDGQCGEHLPFLVGGEEGFHLIDHEAMSQGYVQHIISPDQIHLTINPGSTPMPRNIEGATLTLQSECPETKRKEVSKAVGEGPV